PGAITVTAGLGLLVYAIVDAANAGWGSAATIERAVIAVAFLVVFVLIELRSKAPLVPFSIFRLRTLRGSNVVGLFIGMSLFSMFFFISLYLQQVLGYSALKTGLAYLPLALAIIFAAGGASALVTKFGFKPILAGGLALIAIALVWFTQVSVGGSYLGNVLFPSILAGIGLGFAFVPVTIAAVTGVEGHEAGLASGLINTNQQVGGALGLAILASIANSRTLHVMQGGEPNKLVGLTDGFQLAFLVGAGFAVLGLVATLFIIKSSDSREHAEAAQRGDVAPVAVG
ncbi:MAG: MFS transporter, partial [Patulibacter sp.]|nr:MFS transporter [Patulibacter sp.]